MEAGVEHSEHLYDAIYAVEGKDYPAEVERLDAVIRERLPDALGHSSITVTMDRYGGLFPRLEEAIADGLDDVLRVSLAGPMRDERGTVERLSRSAG